MSSLFACEICSLYPLKMPFITQHLLTHTLSPSGFSAVRPRAREPAPVFHFAPFQKQTREVEAKRDGEEKLRDDIPSNLMAAVVCPVLTRNIFGPRYSPQFPTSRWLMARWSEHMRGSIPKMLGCQFWGWNIIWSSSVVSRFYEIPSLQSSFCLSSTCGKLGSVTTSTFYWLT